MFPVDENFYEIINGDLTKYDLNNNYFHFMKYAYKYKNVIKYKGERNNPKVAYKYSDRRYNKKELEQDFQFLEEEVHKKIRSNVKYGDYPFEYYKVNKNYNYFYKVKDQIIKSAEYASNILVNENEEIFKSYINSLIPGSFIFFQEFELMSPYFSKDDDEFYIIGNPVLKEKVYKIPMIRGSMWKGCLLEAASDLLKEKIENNFLSVKQIIDLYTQTYRIFGTGSERFRSLKDVLDRYIKNKTENGNKSMTVSELEKQLINYALLDLGISLNLKITDKPLIDLLIEHIDKKIETGDLDVLVRKGRAIFYPTYFNRITLEVINPHNRKTKAGTSPIFFEVVPKGTKGYLQIIYIPFDAVLLSESEIAKQVSEDIRFLTKIIEKALTDNGIGAKTKLGWGCGRLIPEKTRFYCNIRGVSRE